MTDYSDHLLACRELLQQAYLAAQDRRFSDSIRLAWIAEAEATSFAEALERLRVEQSAKAGGI